MVCIQVNHSWSIELFNNKFITKLCSKNFLPVIGEGCSISIILSSFLSIFLIAWFVSKLCPLYWLQTNDLPSVLFFPFVAFAVSSRKKAKMNQNLIFRLTFAVLKRLLSSKLQYSVMFLEPEYLYSAMLSLFFSLSLDLYWRQENFPVEMTAVKSQL